MNQVTGAGSMVDPHEYRQRRTGIPLVVYVVALAIYAMAGLALLSSPMLFGVSYGVAMGMSVFTAVCLVWLTSPLSHRMGIAFAATLGAAFMTYLPMMGGRGGARSQLILCVLPFLLVPLTAAPLVVLRAKLGIRLARAETIAINSDRFSLVFDG